jgi:nicotinate-nucleotide adenylyltransferase
MNPSARVGILGGMFDPIHHGHLDTGASAQRALDLTRLLVVPSNIPPHRRQPIASSHHRFAMVSMAIAEYPRWRAMDLELSMAAHSYTSDTLRHFQAIGYLPTQLFFIAGADAFLEIATWKDYPGLLDLAHFAVVARPGVNVGELYARLPALASRMRNVHGTVRLKRDTTADPDLAFEQSDAANDQRTFIFLIDTTTADVSSTAIRQARLDHRTIAGMVPPFVRQHIERHGLYEDPTPRIDNGSCLLDTQAGRLHGQD